MKKGLKFLVVSLMAASLFSISVMAKGSPVEIGSGKSEQGTVVISEVKLDEIKDEKVAKALETVIAEPSKLTEALTEAGVKEISGTKVEDLTLASTVQDIEVVDGDQNPVTGKFEVTLEVPALSAPAGTEVKVLHYSTTRSVWELLTPSKVAGSAITVEFKDASPFAVVYVKSASETKPESPDTGDHSNTTMYMAVAALALVGLAAVTFRKKATK